MQGVCGMVIVILAASPLSAADPPCLVLRTIDGADPVGELLAASADEGMAIRTDAGRRLVVPLADLVEARTAALVEEIETPSRERESSPPGWPRTFATHDGQRLVGTIVGAEGGRVLIHHPWLGRVSVRRKRLAWIAPVGRETPGSRAVRVREEWARRAGYSAPSDRVVLLNGDVIAGRIVALEVGRVRVDTATREVSVGWDKVERITFRAVEPDRPDRSSSSGAGVLEVILDLADGSRLIAADVRYRPADGTFHCPAGAGSIRGSLTVPADRVIRIAVRGGRWQWLSDLDPVEISSASMFGLDWPPMRDGDVAGGPLAVNGRVYERGIGVHANCRLSYALDGGYERFVSLIGIDDDSGDRADVDVRVVVDGRVRFSVLHVRRGDVRDPVRLDVTGARQLELIVTAGANGDVQDRFDWADAGLVRLPAFPPTRPSPPPAGKR